MWPLCWPVTLRKERILPGWTSAGRLFRLSAQADFTVLFLGFLCKVKFPRPAMSAGASVFPQALSGYDLSLRTQHCGQQDASGSPQSMGVEPWGHPGGLPCWLAGWLTHCQTKYTQSPLFFTPTLVDKRQITAWNKYYTYWKVLDLSSKKVAGRLDLLCSFFYDCFFKSKPFFQLSFCDSLFRFQTEENPAASSTFPC